MKKKLIIAIIAAFPLLMVCGGCGNKKKQPSIEEQIARVEYENKVMSKKSCMAKRDEVLKKYFGYNYKLIKSEYHSGTGTYEDGCFYDEGTVIGSINKKNGTYTYWMDVRVNYDNPQNWRVYELHVKDKYSHYVFVINGEVEVDAKEFEEENTISSDDTSETDISVSENDLHSIEDALQREWNISNALSAVGAESSNVFKVKKESVSGREVTVSYSLRSTYGGQKKFVDLHGVVKKNSDGSWSVVNLGY